MKDDAQGEMEPISGCTEEALRDLAAGMAALRTDDPDRVAFSRSVNEDPACLNRLAQGERLMALLDAMPTPAPPSPEVLQRVSSNILADLQRSRSVGWAVGLAAAAAVLLVWTVSILGLGEAGHLHSPWGLSLAVALIAALLAHGLGRGAAATTIAALGVSALLPLAELGGGSLLLAFDKCVVIELGGAVLPLAVTAYLVLSDRLPSRGPLTLASAAAAGALAAQAALHVICPGISGMHLFVFHTGGVVLAALLGWAAGAIPPLRAKLAVPA